MAVTVSLQVQVGGEDDGSEKPMPRDTETGKTGDDDEKMTLQAGRGGERGRRAARHRNEPQGSGRAADATKRSRRADRQPRQDQAGFADSTLGGT
jgi:hypothetical protein